MVFKGVEGIELRRSESGKDLHWLAKLEKAFVVS